MKKSKTYKGLWYLPGHSEKPVAGTLHYKKGEKIILELIGSVSDGESSTPGFILDYDRQLDMIHGESSDGKKITLLYCHSGGNSYTFSCSFPLTSYQCQYIVVGKHLSSPEEKCFNKIKVLTPALPKWIASSLVNREYGLGKDKITNFQINVNQQSEVHADFDITSAFKFSMFSSVGMTGYEVFPEILEISQLSFFSIENKKEKTTLFDFLNMAGLFIQFLSLATNSEQYPIEIYLQDYDDYIPSQKTKRLNQIEILQRNRTKEIEIRRSKFLFSYKDIKDDFELLVKNWFSTSKKLAPIRNHLLESIIQKTTFKSLDFLIVVQALEGYHTRFINRNRTALKLRIDDLIEKYSSDIKKVAEFDFNTQHVVNTRDYYSHFFEKDSRPVIEEGLELYRVTEKLRILLICCVLDLIGFDKQKINTTVNKFNV